MNLETPAAREASTSVVAWMIPAGPRTLITASWPRSWEVRSERVKDVRITLTFSGVVEDESCRVKIVTSKLAARRAWVMGWPKLPVAFYWGSH